MTALVLAALLAADGGIPLDTTYANPSAGIFVVESARQYDGGTLPDGWWLSRARMQKMGEHIAKVETERDVAHLALTDKNTSWGFWAGVALGSATATAVTTVVLLVK